MLSVGLKQVTEYGYIVVISLDGKVMEEHGVYNLEKATETVHKLRNLYGVNQ